MKLLNLIDSKKVVILLACCISIVACSDDDPEDNILKIGNLSAYKVQSLQSPIETGPGATYHWSVATSDTDVFSLTDASSGSARFIGAPGNYTLTLKISEDGETQQYRIGVTVKTPDTAYSPYLSKVYDFLPAIGQFTNELPKYEAGDTKEKMIGKAEASIAGDIKKTSMISLGGFGGYVTFGFDHTIVNVSGKRDLRILGNAFYADANPNPNAPEKGGSCEPGIVMVAYDKNGNGQPDDDEWYEIAGSEYNHPQTIRNYEITYHKPAADIQPNPVEDSHILIKDYIFWEDNQGNSGYKEQNIYHTQNYYPEWLDADKVTFKGTLLPPNAIDESGNGSYWVLYAFGYGYADNALNTDDDSAIDIDWAVDANGNKVSLPGVDFVKVYTGLNQECGWLGETSTEISGAVDLHISNTSIHTY